MHCRLRPLVLVVSLVLAFSRVCAAEELEAELFPPEFLYGQREALGLSPAQLEAMSAVMSAGKDDFEKRKGELENRAKALQEVLRQPQPDVKLAEEKLRSLLLQETEVKTLHMITMLKVRAQLTAEQLEKARKLRDELLAQTAAKTGERDRIQEKLAQLRDIAKARADAQNLPPEVVERAREIQQMLKEGKEQQAEAQLDSLLNALNTLEGKK